MTQKIQHLNPDTLIKNPAFTNVVVVPAGSTTIYIGGLDANTPDGQIVGKGDIAAQTEQVLKNLEAALAAAGAAIENVVKWNIYIVQGQPLAPGFQVFQRFWGNRTNPPPAISSMFVAALANPDYLVELDAIAVLPN
jgi:enamine deaminase RidA (YjgF/YER057c/UK114 family)